MKKLLLLFSFFFITTSSISQTTLSVGDIAILQYNADYSPHAIKFLALASMESGTTINFTDNGWNGSALNSDEGTDIWTASGNIKAGEIIDFTLTNVSLGTDGDQLIAYQGTSGSPTFIFALNNEGSAVWQAGSPNTRESALPTGLTNGTNAVALTERDNYRFKTTAANRKGKKSLILSSICNSANWNGHNSNEKIFSQVIKSEIKWNGSAWIADDTPGTPDQYFLTNLRQDYTTSSNGTFNANELEIRSGKNLTISAGDNITIQNSITNSGDITIEDNASLVQIIPDGPNTGTGYTVNRISTSQQEQGNYTFWASPLASSTLANVTSNAENYYSFSAASQSWVIASSATSMTPGLGYVVTGDELITYPNTYTASFTGSTFNNGDVTVALGFNADADPDTDWNLLGNPYPSAIDADAFIADNTTIGGTLYFWTHNSLDSAGDNVQDDYVLWNGSGGTGTCGGCTPPDGNIASGQGFYAQALSAGNATFTNSMRVTGSNSLFYKGRKKQKDRIWLNLTSNNNFSQILVGFFENATDGEDRIYDGLRLDSGNSISFYSILNGKNYGIQGKSTLKETETIPLGFNANITGEFKIEIENIEGLLNKSRVVLFDKLLNVKHNLKKASYTFNVDVIGENNNRFELLINPKKIEITDETDKGIKIFLKRKIVHIKSKKLIKRIRILDIYGNRLYNKKVNGKEFKINLRKRKIQSIYIIKVILENGNIITKKVIE